MCIGCSAAGDHDVRAGRLRHIVSLEAPSRTPTEHGYQETWTAYATGIPVEIVPATPALVERSVMTTTQTPVTHLVRLRYRADVAVRHRVKYGTRLLYIGGLRNVDERGRELELACEERVS